jgi:hypothetical protein
MRSIIKIVFIGVLHSTCYLWLLPDLILPRFGNNGTRFTVAVLGVISVILISGLIKRGAGKRKVKSTTDSE